ncbi:phosphonate ABC transporter substrate-binding protein [uncultured Ferrovibrio sp.]|jgi:phosphonate transport system substrate-binding protein|uniref:phosphonate ABC transporter substrate-binding protein n=1 Tax=uncultured Ferrovibrio sp. TaxID=1576913 RepID=UPI002631E58C|nr:phosphonate ABC transporter substrate-binding protein [uncultured Ferrovibrio sp.]
MLRRTILKATMASLALAAYAQNIQASELKEVNFGIISTESSANLRTVWEPFLADMEKLTGYKVNAFFAPDYAGVIEGMRFNKVQVAWYGNASAMQAVDRADGEIFAQTTSKDGAPGYWSLLLAHKDSPINSLEDVLKAPGKYTLGNGDPNSTSGFLVPGFYAWGQNNIDVRKHFARVVTGNHEVNALAVANRQVDLATNNNENLERLQKSQPAKAAEVKTIWKSPLIPSDPIVWRKDLPEADKTKIKAFFMTYGTRQPGKPAERLNRELKVLADLQWGPFRESSNKQLLPIRQLALFRDKLKIEADANMAADEKARKLAEIEAKLADLNRQMGS